MKEASRKSGASAFTLIELMIATAVLALLVLLFESLFNGASTAANLSATHSEADDIARQLFMRMAADFSRMVKRADIDYYVKSSSAGSSMVGTTLVSTPIENMGSADAGGPNDQMAFYSEVAGYSTAADAQNTVSLVAYRVNSQGAAATPLPFMERMGKALSWTASDSAEIQQVVFEPQTITGTWPAATSPTASDPDYEMIAPNVFRFEYYYVLRSGLTSTVPWDKTAGSTSINGFKDVAAIGVVIAIADRKVSTLATLTQLTSLASSLVDFNSSQDTQVGDLEQTWMKAVTSSTVPTTTKNGIRIYGRLFPISHPFE